MIKDGVSRTGTYAVLGPGTGLGKSFLRQDSKGKILGFPSEGGHASFPAQTKEELNYLSFMMDKLGAQYVSCEHVLCGNSLVLMYEYFYSLKLSVTNVSEKIKEGLANEMCQMYSKFLARVSRNFALEVLSDGGVILGGGVLSKTPELLVKEAFCQEFVDSPTQRDFLEKVKVESFNNEDSGLWGAANFGRQIIN